MISEKMQQALNDQINAELYSTYLYLSMQAYFESVELPGCARWMHAQVMEESVHAMKIFDYVNSRRGTVTLKSIDQPPNKWQSALDVFKATCKHEQLVTSLINDLVNLSIEQKDHAANNFLQWFVDEQVEEEASVKEVVGKLKMIENMPSGIFMVDRELGQRIFTPPQIEGEK